MNRRSLLRVLAAIPGFAFLKPKEAKAFTVIGPDDLKAKPLNFKMYERMPYTPGTHKYFYRMVADIRKHVAANPGCEVLSCDEPMRGQLGYAVGGPNTFRSFSIAVHDLKSRYSMLGYNETQIDAIRKMLGSRLGRLQFAKMLAGQSQVPS